ETHFGRLNTFVAGRLPHCRISVAWHMPTRLERSFRAFHRRSSNSRCTGYCGGIVATSHMP
ncbi:hypothetical protein HAX54_003146, partial [Datura stramonium]|nr:hypothetical protein [Datura stramonium]